MIHMPVYVVQDTTYCRGYLGTHIASCSTL